jgi:hypothetical protein
MGALIACCAGQALCCAGQLCCSCLCKPCEAAGVASKNFSKIGYVVFQLLWVVVSLVVMFNTDHFMWMATSEMVECPDWGVEDEICFGISLLLRMSFSLFILHSLIFIIILGRNSVCAAFHDGCWAFKSLLLLAMYVGTFWIPNNFFISTYF